jgi:hypothetical protein
MSDEPHFIEADDPNDVPRPIPIFVTKSRPDRSHAEAMKKMLASDPTYAAKLHAELSTEGVVDELAVLDCYEQSKAST